MITIRKAAREDAQILTDIKNCALDRELRKYLGRGGRPVGYDDASAELMLMREYDVREILLDEKIIGGFFMQWVSGTVVEIEDFAIAPEYQGQGYGFRVLKLIEDMYPDVYEWRLSALSISVGNQHLYEKAGYVVVGRDDVEVRYCKKKGISC